MARGQGAGLDRQGWRAAARPEEHTHLPRKHHVKHTHKHTHTHTHTHTHIHTHTFELHDYFCFSSRACLFSHPCVSLPSVAVWVVSPERFIKTPQLEEEEGNTFMDSKLIITLCCVRRRSKPHAPTHICCVRRRSKPHAPTHIITTLLVCTAHTAAHLR
jgi:hypothetical protein